MPIDSLKNASPMAVSTTGAVILCHSGRNKKASPAGAPGSVRLKPHSSSSSANSSGISFLVSASIPLVTPNSKMPPMNASTAHCHSSDCTGSPVRASNAAWVAAGSRVNRLPPSALAT